jgi:ribosome modulation factor
MPLKLSSCRMNKRPDYVQEGADAHSRGVRRALCPYLPGTVPEELWLKGWDEAKAKRDRFLSEDDE